MALGPNQTRLAIFAALGTAALWGLSRLRGKGSGPASWPEPECDQIGSSGGVIGGMRYLERRSQGADTDDKLPMVIVFHSRAGRPEGFANFHMNLRSPARVILPEGPGTIGDYRSWFSLPARTSEQGELAKQMVWTSDQVRRFIQDVVRCRPTHGMPIVTGSSQGGSMAYLMASQTPQLVRGAVAVSGWLPRALWTPQIPRTIGIHGDDDTVVPYAWSKEYAEAMSAQGAPITFESFSAGHEVTVPMAQAWRDGVNEMLES